MKKLPSFITVSFVSLSIVLVIALASSLVSCSSTNIASANASDSAVVEVSKDGSTELSSTVSAPVFEVHDFASELKLDTSSETCKQVVTVKTFVDGDTVHFNVPQSVMSSGVLKARFLALNTPESTGRIEEYGKKASSFTKEKLSNATSIIIESDNDSWNKDSTGSRYLVWVWYKPAGSDEYRNLNIEILQNGLAIASSTANNRYGSVAMTALMQAKALKLNVFSGQKDPDFYYGDAVELTLNELRLNIEKYNGIKVAFEGVVAKDDGGSVYIEEYDSETDMYNGVSVYYGYNLPGPGLKAISVGNRVRIVGTVQYYETGQLYQVSGLSYKLMDPNNPSNVKMLGSGYSAAFVKTSADTFVNGKVLVESSDGSCEYDYAYLALSTTLEMDDLVVKEVLTTSDLSSSSYGAMTLICDSNDSSNYDSSDGSSNQPKGVEVRIRTTVFTDGKGNLIKADTYLGKTIDVKGLVDCFEGSYQIKVISPKDITVKN